MGHHRGPNPGRSKSGPGSCTGTTRSDGHTGGAVRDGDGLKGKAFLAKGPKMSMDLIGLENMDHVLEYGVM